MKKMDFISVFCIDIEPVTKPRPFLSQSRAFYWASNLIASKLGKKESYVLVLCLFKKTKIKTKNV